MNHKIAARFLLIIACVSAIIILIIPPMVENFTFRQSLVSALGILFLTPALTMLFIHRRPRQAFVSLIACFSAYIFFLGVFTLSYSISATLLATCAIAATAVAAETLLMKIRPFGAVVNLIAGAGFVFLLGGMVTDNYGILQGIFGAVALWVIAAAVAIILNTRQETEHTRFINPLQPESHIDE